jgi:hypothetical protein
MEKIIEKIVYLTDWAIVDWDGSKRLLGMNDQNKLVRTSTIVNQLDNNKYQTQSGTIYVLSGDPNKEWVKVSK